MDPGAPIQRGSYGLGARRCVAAGDRQREDPGDGGSGPAAPPVDQGQRQPHVAQTYEDRSAGKSVALFVVRDGQPARGVLWGEPDAAVQGESGWRMDPGGSAE